MVKKAAIIMIIITASISTAFAQAFDPSLIGGSENYDSSNYEPLEIQPIPMKMDVIQTIPVGDGDFKLGYRYEDSQGGMTSSPHDVMITEDEIYFYDEVNLRLVGFSRDFSDFKNFGAVFEMDIYNFLDGDQEYLISSNGVYNLIENRTMFEIGTIFFDKLHPEYGGINLDNFIFVDGRYLILDNRANRGIILLDLKIENETEVQVMYDEEAVQYINENSLNIEVIDGRFILSNHSFTTKSVLNFINYVTEYNSELNYNKDEMLDYLAEFSGIDSDDNFYLTGYENQVFIFEPEGNFIQAIQAKIPQNSDLVMWKFRVDDDGNIYSLAIDDERKNYQLLQIPRSW